MCRRDVSLSGRRTSRRHGQDEGGGGLPKTATARYVLGHAAAASQWLSHSRSHGVHSLPANAVLSSFLKLVLPILPLYEKPKSLRMKIWQICCGGKHGSAIALVAATGSFLKVHWQVDLPPEVPRGPVQCYEGEKGLSRACST